MWVAWGEAPDLGSGVDERVSQLIDLALVEDIGPGDVTSEFFVPGDRMARAFLVAKEKYRRSLQVQRRRPRARSSPSMPQALLLDFCVRSVERLP